LRNLCRFLEFVESPTKFKCKIRNRFVKSTLLPFRCFICSIRGGATKYSEWPPYNIKGQRRANVAYYISIYIYHIFIYLPFYSLYTRINMSAQKRGREVSSATRGAIAYARYQDRSPLRVIQARTGVSLSTISDICNHAHKQAKIHETKSFHGENTAPGSRSGRPPLLCQEQIDIMIKLVTSSYEWRRRS